MPTAITVSPDEAQNYKFFPSRNNTGEGTNKREGSSSGAAPPAPTTAGRGIEETAAISSSPPAPNKKRLRTTIAVRGGLAPLPPPGITGAVARRGAPVLVAVPPLLREQSSNQHQHEDVHKNQPNNFFIQRALVVPAPEDCSSKKQNGSTMINTGAPSHNKYTSSGCWGAPWHQRSSAPQYSPLLRPIESNALQMPSAENSSSVKLGLSNLQEAAAVATSSQLLGNNHLLTTPPVIQSMIVMDELKPREEQYYRAGGDKQYYRAGGGKHKYRKLDFSHMKDITEIRNLALELLKSVQRSNEHKVVANLEQKLMMTVQLPAARHQYLQEVSNGGAALMTVQVPAHYQEGPISGESRLGISESKYDHVIPIPTKLNNLRPYHRECKDFERCCNCKLNNLDAKRSRFKGGVANFADTRPTPIPMNAQPDRFGIGSKKSKVFHKRRVNDINSKSSRTLAIDYFFTQQPNKNLDEPLVKKLISSGLGSEGGNVLLPLEDHHWKGIINTIETAFQFQLEQREEMEALLHTTNHTRNEKKGDIRNISIPTKLRKLSIAFTAKGRKRRLVSCPCKVFNDGCCVAGLVVGDGGAGKGAAGEGKRGDEKGAGNIISLSHVAAAGGDGKGGDEEGAGSTVSISHVLY